MHEFDELLHAVRDCTLCEPDLPLGARPVLQAAPQARILIAGQAPGRKVHASGMVFDDASGERLREWMGIERTRFYDPAQIAVLPMGFCYPGSSGSGDAPPNPQCADTWRLRLLTGMPRVELTLLLGRYAQAWHLPDDRRRLTARVKDWRATWPEMLPLPHPSPRNNRWLRQNAWFETEVIPELRARVKQILSP